MLSRVIIIGTTTHIPMQFVDSNGFGLDHSTGSRVTRLRLTLVTGGVPASAPAYTLLTTDSSQFTWTSQTTGEGKWLFESDDPYTAGEYVASIIYTDPSATPDDVYPLGEARWTFRHPNTGAL